MSRKRKTRNPSPAAKPAAPHRPEPAADSGPPDPILERALRTVVRVLSPPTDPATFFTEEDQAAIAEATRRAESGTSAEIRLAVVARCRKRAAYAALQIAAAVSSAALVLAVLAFLVEGRDPVAETDPDPEPSVTWERTSVDPFLATGLSLAAALLAWIAAGRLARSRAIRLDGRAIWNTLRMEATRDRTGILLLVALEERLVRLHADRAVAAKIPRGTWSALVSRVASGLSGEGARPGAARRAVCEAIEEIGRLTASDFPRAADDVNELPDQPYVRA